MTFGKVLDGGVQEVRGTEVVTGDGTVLLTVVQPPSPIRTLAHGVLPRPGTYRTSQARRRCRARSPATCKFLVLDGVLVLQFDRTLDTLELGGASADSPLAQPVVAVFALGPAASCF